MEVAGDAMETEMIVAAETPMKPTETGMVALERRRVPVSSVESRDITREIARKRDGNVPLLAVLAVEAVMAQK